MDFWTRLLGGGSQKKQAVSNNPQQRLARFKRVYNEILQTWHKTSSLANDTQAIAKIRACFQRLTSILNDESRSPAPHLCLAFAASSHIYNAVSKIVSTAYNEGVVRDGVALFGALLDSEEEDFLENDQFAQSLMNFIGRIVGSGSMAVGEDTEAEIVELLFGISAKIRLQPEILPVWFTSRASYSNGRLVNQKVDFAGVTQKEDFPLCYQLIDHVHHEGRIGDFARTGLLYIFESASKSQDLEQWIVGSDLPTLMASGLGALYSQLSRKLSILHPTKDLPIILSLSDYHEMQNSSHAESLFSPEFQMHMDTFLSYLTFWQDVLEHCRSIDVRHTLIDHFQVLFLQQLLYPSLLESSDMDGGSSVAVLTYLRRILNALDHPELVHMILHYLLALPDSGADGRPRTPRSPVALQRRKSLMLLSQPENDDDRMNPSLFNLVDLILTSTESRNPQTVISALKLMTVILGKNHSYAVGTLLKVLDIHHKEPQRTVGALDAEMDTYLSLAISMAGEPGVDEAYESHLKDTLSHLESHPCSLRMLSLADAGVHSPEFFAIDGARDVNLHYILPEDPLLRSLLRLLSQFFTNDVETNLALTEAFIQLGSCAKLRLEGWISVEPSRYLFPPESEHEEGGESEDFSRDIAMAERQPTWTSQNAPAIISCLSSLKSQIEALRGGVPDFEQHLANRKQAFHVHEEITEAMKSTTPQSKSTRPSADLPAGTWTPQIPKHVLESSSTPSRAQSPRGRKEGLDVRQTPTASPTASSRFGGQTLISSPIPSRGLSPAPKGQRQTTLMADVLSNLAEVADVEALKRRIRFRKGPDEQSFEVVLNPAAEDSQGGEEAGEDDFKDASLGHILTNILILQEFVLELAALLQVRASLFGEVRFA